VPNRERHPDSTSPIIEDVRQGTRKQYVSDWTEIKAGTSLSFTHELGEVPWCVDVLRAAGNQGVSAVALYQSGKTLVDAAGAAAVSAFVKSDSVVTLTNGSTDAYFRVRAL